MFRRFWLNDRKLFDEKSILFTKCLCQSIRMEASSPEVLLEAFRVLDQENKGFLTKEFMTKVMMEEGEPFTQVNKHF